MQSSLGEQKWVPRASRRNPSTSLCNNRWRCNSHNKKKKTEDEAPGQTARIGTHFPVPKKKKRSSFVVASSLICWPILENIFFERFLRQQYVKVYRRLEDPTCPKTWTLLKTLCHTCLSEEAKTRSHLRRGTTRVSLCELSFDDCYVFSGHRIRATYSGMSEIQTCLQHTVSSMFGQLCCVAMLRLSLLRRETEVSLLRCKMQQRVVTQQ